MKRALLIASLTIAGLCPGPAFAATGEKVGEAVKIDTLVSGQGGALGTGDAIHRDERIRTNPTGIGTFRLEDGTKLAVGANSSIVIDDYVYGGGSTAKRLAISATKGTLRWISGGSDHSAYKIDTPSGTLGVRGTAFDVYVGAGGVTAVVLLNGAAQFCNASGCQKLTRRCDFIVAYPGGAITKPKGVVRQLGLKRTGDDVFPFLAGNAALPAGFKGSSTCEGLSSRAPRGGGGSGAPQHKPLGPRQQPDRPNTPGDQTGGGLTNGP